MARWNLRRALAETADANVEVEPSERPGWSWPTRSWTAIGPDSGLYEQFAGFFELEPL